MEALSIMPGYLTDCGLQVPGFAVWTHFIDNMLSEVIQGVFIPFCETLLLVAFGIKKENGGSKKSLFWK